MRTCALLPLVKNNIEPLMLLLKIELDNLYSFDNNTKCLYTAVAVMALYLGKRSLFEVEKCDVRYVMAYYSKMKDAARLRNPASTFDPSALLVKQCAKSLLSPTKASRFLYYVMITNADAVQDKVSNKSPLMFPGHVCVIEKYPSGRYYVYQSYINEYDLSGHYDKNGGSFVISKKLLEELFVELARLYEGNGIWTPKMSKLWKEFTHVDASQFEGFEFKGKSFFCYRQVPIKICAKRLVSMIDNANRLGDKSQVDVKSMDALQRLKETIASSNFSI